MCTNPGSSDTPVYKTINIFGSRSVKTKKFITFKEMLLFCGVKSPKASVRATKLHMIFEIICGRN